MTHLIVITMVRTCKRGTIRRVSFTRKSGSRVKSRCVRNMGAPGKWTAKHRSTGIGPLKQGRLAKFGYNTTQRVGLRRQALRKAVKSEGKTTVLRMLQAVATYTKRTSPKKSALFLADRAAVAKMK